ncbi:threonine-phosphate decarboxylase CobD [Massilia sp. TWP1-3-3]|uniref:threonine-phosphate decarboxylase CobD n=1 Tax=Massilia sp. TWP1-3-3 TaxID=2804573 RepID=UPI003CF761A6
MLEHGGNLREAARRFGRDLSSWVDLSAGLNPHGYAPPAMAPSTWHRLPETDPQLLQLASRYYGAPSLIAVAGTQAAIQALPQLRPPSRVVVAAPSYAEHAHHWGLHGHATREVPYDGLQAALPRCDVMVLCNPNNPTGATVPSERLLMWAEHLATRAGWLVVDEAFADTDPALSVAARSGQPGLIVLRSIGKFFGLAGARVGFVAAQPALLDKLADMLGPWTISGPAQQVAMAALADTAWQGHTLQQLTAAGLRLRLLLAQHGIASQGTALFQWWPEPQAQAFWRHMAERGIWVRLFEQGARGIRLGLPPDESAWRLLDAALNEWKR